MKPEHMVNPVTGLPVKDCDSNTVSHIVEASKHLRLYIDELHKAAECLDPNKERDSNTAVSMRNTLSCFQTLLDQTRNLLEHAQKRELSLAQERGQSC